MKTLATVAALALQLSMEIQTFTLTECREAEGIVGVVQNEKGDQRFACLFSDGTHAWLKFETLDVLTDH